MKPALQGWSPTPASWQDTVPFVLNSKGDLVIGNIKQSKLFHYVEKDFLTPVIMQQLERLANE
jgi:ABC-type amino acid transport substrate-binding protein